MTFFRRSYGSLSLLLVGAGFLFLAVIVLASVWIASGARDQNLTVALSQEISSSANQLMSLLERAETGRRGYLLTGEQRFAEVAERAMLEVEAPLSRLHDYIAGPALPGIPGFEELVERKLQNIVQSLALAREGRRDEASAAFLTDEGIEDLMMLRLALDQVVTEQTAAVVAGVAAASRNTQNFVFVTILSVIVLLSLAAASIMLLRSYSREINQSQEELSRLNRGLEAVVGERTADLVAANDEIQRFAYIVSHDLRSPLVNIMGFTSELEAGLVAVQGALREAAASSPETVSVEAREAVETDWPEAIGFIRRATEKMDRLINAILKVSREGRTVFAPQPLKMTEVMGDIVEAAQRQAAEAGAEVRIGPLPDIVSDRIAVEQVFGNLVDNAVKYLDERRPGVIEIEGRAASAGFVEFTVRDNGRGIDSRDLERIFELFRRSGAQDRPGEGIGLAHVRPLVRRMGGAITCTSTLGEGTEFTVRLPEVMQFYERGAG